MRNPANPDVIIAGSGIAACSCALRLLSVGFHPLLLSRGGGIQWGAEAIAGRALPLFSELGLDEALEKAGAEAVDGFENRWNAGSSVTKDGRHVHVERRALARAALDVAIRSGAAVRTCKGFPGMSKHPAGAGVMVDGFDEPFFAALDATGRSALWSRPVKRAGTTDIASIFESRERSLERARVVRFDTGWGYAIPQGNGMTIAVVGRAASTLDAEARDRLGVYGHVRFAGRRPAFPQWCAAPIDERRIAVGDAALAFSPIAGQGILFALQSAFACSAVLLTMRDSRVEAAAGDYYTEFVSGARNRHLAWLSRPAESDGANGAVSIPDVVRFSGTTRLTGVQRNDRVVLEEAVELTDGGMVRWVGGIDLLEVRTLALSPVKSTELAARLSGSPAGTKRAWRLIAWCIKAGVLA